jgi:hypothetical protein
MTDPETQFQTEWDVVTTSRGSIIQQRVVNSDGTELLSQVIDLRNRQLREHLIKLGWSPPVLDPSRPMAVVVRQEVPGDPSKARYRLECGHWVTRRNNSTKRSALCDHCMAFPGITA